VNDISFTGDTLQIGDRWFTMAYPIDDAFPLGDLVVILFAPDSRPSLGGQFPNLIAVEPATGNQVWQAELPTTYTGDAYYQVRSRDPLVAASVKSFVCRIDPATGKVVEKEFVK
jgi:hypothetical protein